MMGFMVEELWVFFNELPRPAREGGVHLPSVNDFQKRPELFNYSLSFVQ